MISGAEPVRAPGAVLRSERARSAARRASAAGNLALRAAAVGLLATAALGGCLAYSPAPTSPAAAAHALAARHPDVEAIRAERLRLLAGAAPDIAAWDESAWDEAALLAAARLAHPDLIEARARIAAAQKAAAAARIAPGPVLSLTAEYAFNPVEPSHLLFGLAGDQLLDLGGRRKGRIDLALADARQADYAYNAALWRVRMAIRRALDAVAGAAARADLLGAIVGLEAQQKAVFDRQLAAGAIARPELQAALAAAAQDQRALRQAEADGIGARIEVWAASGLGASGVPSATIATEAPWRALPQPDRSRLSETAGEDQDAIASLHRRPEILAATIAYDQAEAALRVAIAGQFPAVSIGPGYTFERGLQKLPLNLSLAFPSLDLNRAAIRAAEAGRVAAGRALEAAVARSLADIALARAHYLAAISAAAAARTVALPAAEANARLTDAQFAAGAVDRVIWAGARIARQRAALDALEADLAALAAARALEDALQIPLFGPLAPGGART